MDYQPGDEIILLIDIPTTLQDCGIDPFLTSQIHTNRSITTQHTPHIAECINICLVKPHWH